MQSKLFFGLNFTHLSTSEIVDKVISADKTEDEKFKLLVTTNVDHLVTMKKKPQFKDLCENAWIVTADGFPVYKFLRFMKQDVKGRITGADLFPLIMEKLDSSSHSPFFIVGQQKTADFLKTWLEERNFDNVSERIVVPYFGFENDEQYTKDLLNKISSNNVTHLFFGVGAPKSEIWMDNNKEHLQGLKGFGFGAGIDFFAGEAKRAPEWMQKYGLEWSYRLFSEPRRLAKRYLVSSWSFLFLALAEYKKHRKLR